MAVLNAADRDTVAGLFSGAERPVRVLVLRGDQGAEPQFSEILNEIAELAPVVSIEERDWQAGDEGLAARGPSIVLLDGSGDPLGVRFSGYPQGYEFGAFVQDLADAARGASGLSAATLNALRGLEKPVRIQVFTTPTWPYCPRAVRLAHQFAMASPKVEGDAVDAMEFRDLAMRFQVMGVPKTVFNESVEVEGAVPEAVFLKALLQAAAE